MNKAVSEKEAQSLYEFLKNRGRSKKTLKENGFYHWPSWRKARTLALQRDRYVCQLRLSKKCTRIATEVHHIKDTDDYPELALDLDNLTSCCWWCHEETKTRKHQALPVGVRVIKMTDGSDQESD